MTFQTAAIGVSQEAWELEKQHYLQGSYFLARTLQWLSNRVCWYYSIPTIEVQNSRNMGKGRKTATLGRMREDGIMRLAPRGRNLAVTIHELAHWKSWTAGTSMRHNKAFRTTHVGMLKDFTGWNIVGLEELLQTHTEHWYWENFRDEYERWDGDLHELDTRYAKFKPDGLMLRYKSLM